MQQSGAGTHHRRQAKEFRPTYFTKFRQKTRHCERSEAIVSFKSGNISLKRVAPHRNEGRGRERP